jgi:hypothetical protein
VYTKVFRQIYDGTLADNWQALITFQQLLVLADEAGVVDMTVAAIHRITGIPVEILDAGIAALEAPDHGSRTPDMEGRRIVRLDEHRDWGWFLVNFRKYRQMVSKEEKKEADRQRINNKRHGGNVNENIDVAECRELSLGVAGCSDVSQSVADVAHAEAEAEAEAEADTEAKKKKHASSPSASLPTILTLTLNDKSEFSITEPMLTAFREGYPAVDVIGELRKVKVWCTTNPEKRKTRRGVLSFVNRWLSKAQDAGGMYRGQGGSTQPQGEAPPRTAHRLGSDQ